MKIYSLFGLCLGLAVICGTGEVEEEVATKEKIERSRCFAAFSNNDFATNPVNTSFEFVAVPDECEKHYKVYRRLNGYNLPVAPRRQHDFKR